MLISYLKATWLTSIHYCFRTKTPRIFFHNMKCKPILRASLISSVNCLFTLRKSEATLWSGGKIPSHWKESSVFSRLSTPLEIKFIETFQALKYNVLYMWCRQNIAVWIHIKSNSEVFSLASLRGRELKVIVEENKTQENTNLFSQNMGK